MKTKLQVTFLLLFVYSLCFSQAPTIKWQKTYGGSSDDQARAIEQTTDGGYIIAGISKTEDDGQVTGHHGGFAYDFWIVKIKGGGKIDWEKSFGGSQDDVANAVQQTTDGGYIVAGSTESNDGDVTGLHGEKDYWVVKLDNKGILQWQKTLGGTARDVAQSVMQTSDGGYIVAGSAYSSNGDVTGHHDFQDYWVVKLDDDGNIVWQKSLGGSATDVATSVRQTADGGYIVAGFTASNDGDVTGNHGSDDYWIVKLDVNGNIVWQKTYGGSALDDAYSIKQNSSGGYFVAGNSISNNGDVSGVHDFVYGDYWVIKLDASGSLLWQKAVGGNDYDIAYDLNLTSDGGCVVAGTARSTNGDITDPHGNYDFWIVKFSKSGAMKWQLSLGGSDYDIAYSVQQVSGGYITAGFTFSTDGDITSNHGNNDFWVVKLKNAATPAGEFREIETPDLVTQNPEPAADLAAYATPNGSVAIDFKLADAGSQPAVIELINSNGEIILRKDESILNGMLNDQIQPASKLPDGIYFVRVISADHYYNTKFLYQQ